MPKNILLLIADDLGKQLGCYGNRKIQTPHIDNLASQGTKFTHAFTSTASCSASRSVIYTGLHTHQNGQYGLASGRHHFTTFDGVASAPKIFGEEQVGYLTGIIGKVHVGPESVYPWEVREESGTRDVAWVADRATAFFERAVREERKGFFLTIGFIDPHRDRTRSGFGNGDPFDERVKRAEYKDEGVEVPEFITDHPGTRFEFAEYYKSIDRLDQGVGMVLAGLEKAGVAKDTLVIFLSDNGPPFINSKTTLYDAGVCLPLIVRCPGQAAAAAGVVNPNMVSFVDILPTCFDWAKATPPEDHRRLGRSILPILSNTDENQEWAQVFGSHAFHEISNYWPTRFLRTRRHKYHRNIAWRLDFPIAADLYGSVAWEDIRNDGKGMIGPRPLKDYFFRPPEELYDLEHDPDEVKNLAKDPASQTLLKELRDELERWQRRSEDPWLYRDGISTLLVKHHLDAGMLMPDRWDFDVERPESKGPNALPAVENLPFGRTASG